MIQKLPTHDLIDEEKLKTTTDKQLPQIDSHLTAKLYFDNAVAEISLVRSNQDNDFNNKKLISYK